MASPALTTTQLIQILGGVATASKAPVDIVEQTKQWFHQIASRDDLSRNCTQEAEKTFPFDVESWFWALSQWPPGYGDGASALASLTIAVTTLREHSRRNFIVSKTKLTRLWETILEALNCPVLQDTWVPSRSAQGFLAVPICSITQDGEIDELIRLHVWLPDGNRGNPDFSIHSHQPFAQSWILAGEGTDHQYEAYRVAQTADATHMEFGLSWNAGNGLSRSYSTHQHSSVVAPTGKLVRTREVDRNIHRRNDSYTIPAGVFHSSQVLPDLLHATLFYFDSSRGFVRDAPILGPIKGDAFTQIRDPAGETPKSLASYVQLIRSWETHMEEGREYARKAEWERSLRAFTSGLSLCESPQVFRNVKRYRGLVFGELGNTNRRFGRYEVSEGLLKQACLELQGSPEYATFNGELGVVYRHMNRLEEAKDAFQLQYETAKELQLESEACRAIGNLGMVNYQLAEQSRDDDLLNLAIDQLQERVDRCDRMRNTVGAADRESVLPERKLSQIEVWAAVGLARLSLCWTAQKNEGEALKAAESALEHAKNTGDPTVVAISRFFYGRAFAMNGQHEQALEQFNAQDGCTPAIAFCKEPSGEHNEYLRCLVDAGADMDLLDDQGYRALDYAVFNGDETSQRLVLEGLRHQFSSEPDVNFMLEQRQREAKLRKGYRELFQEKLRLVLLTGGQDCIKKLQIAYSEALAADKEKDSMFDHFKVISYAELLRFGRVPRYSDGLTRRFAISNEAEKKHFVIFFSYRWLNPMKGQDGGTPDDGNHTQYARMMQAIENFLEEHKDVDSKCLQIWIVSPL
ncbi:uncharacterized protein TRIVIDRAFT_49569 [Trichoderma virens Gv29-8]|uniref:Uncharacterized protein n=1 Tax=Hypocrea virens (strain Gv29-8 / FGSC 10586) TaxID=413071 RepID=G9N2D2_HYPVG|nr:uncharacterized protein TRIVIDRAFT_49569 [Trichoderma virens Gv29-8]EHK19245.1 hypothetical protein TRIVIDRAFT_49569 [Trichoderma virens Gv29-8]